MFDVRAYLANIFTSPGGYLVQGLVKVYHSIDRRSALQCNHNLTI